MGVLTTILIVWGALIAVTLVLALTVLRSGGRADQQAELDVDRLIRERLGPQVPPRPTA